MAGPAGLRPPLLISPGPVPAPAAAAGPSVSPATRTLPSPCLSPAPVARLERPATKPTPTAPAVRSDQSSEDDADYAGGRLLCAGCRAVITHRRERVERGGAHEHGRINPAGFSFHLACFAAAPGAATLGPATREHTWFPGYAWRIALCGGCGEQLGWRFEAGADRFFGLIVGRLVPEHGAPPG